MKCLGRDRCEVRLGSWRSSDASLSMKCLGRDRCEVRLGSWRSSDASRSMKCLGRDRFEVHLGLHLAWVIFSCFVSLRESYPTHPAESEGASTCEALQPTSTYLCFAEMTARFANFQFTDFNQNAYQPIRDCVSWGQIRASVDFYWSSPLMKCHWISRGLLTKWICLRRSDSKNLENLLEFLEIMEIWW